jgi:hypothetical protein
MNLDIMKQGPNGQMQGPGGNGTKRMGPDQDPIRGPQAARYDPTSNGGERKFKGGVKNGKNDTLCKKRYQQIAITALGNLTQSTTRILQTSNTTTSTPTYSMQLTVGAGEFSDESSARAIIASFASLVVVALAMIMT